MRSKHPGSEKHEPDSSWPPNVTMGDVVDAMRDLLDCVEPDDLDVPVDERTYSLRGYVHDAVVNARRVVRDALGVIHDAPTKGGPDAR